MRGRWPWIVLGVLAALGGALVLHGVAFVRARATGFGDYQQFHLMWEAGRQAILRHGELPLWNPFQCGGMPEVGFANTHVFHPLFLLALPFGSTLGLKLFVLAHAAAGLAGMYLLVRRGEGHGRLAAALAAGAWAGCTFFAWHAGLGHGNFLPFYLLPWCVLAWRSAVRTPWRGLLVGAVLAAMLLGGGGYAFAFAAVVIAIEAAFELAPRASRGTAARALVVAAAAALLLGAPRLVPVLENVRQYPRTTPRENDSLRPGELVESLTARRAAFSGTTFRAHHWGNVEYDAYLGWGVIALAALGAATRRSGRRRNLAGAAVGLALAAGAAWTWAPWSLLHRLPIYDSLQVPSRWLVVAVLYLCLLAAAGAERILARARRVEAPRRRRVAVALIALGVGALVADGWLLHREVVARGWRNPPVDHRPPGPRFHLREVPRTPAERVAPSTPPSAWLARANLGTGLCYTGFGFHPAFGLWSGDQPQIRALPDAGAEVVQEGRTHATWTARVELDRPGRVIFNGTWAPGWSTSTGWLVSDLGRLAVDLPPGSHRVVLRYRSRTWRTAAVLGALGAALLVAAAIRRSRGRVELAAGLLGLAALPVYVVATRPVAPPAAHGARAVSVAARALRDGDPETPWVVPVDRWGDVERATLTLDAPRPVGWIAVLVPAGHANGGIWIGVEAWRAGERVAQAGESLAARALPRRVALRVDAVADRIDVVARGTPNGRLSIAQIDVALDPWLPSAAWPAGQAIVDALRRGEVAVLDASPQIHGGAVFLHPNAPGAAPASLVAPMRLGVDDCFTGRFEHGGPPGEGDGVRFLVKVNVMGQVRTVLDRHVAPGGTVVVPPMRLRALGERAAAGSVVLEVQPEQDTVFDWARVADARVGPCPGRGETFR